MFPSHCHYFFQTVAYPTVGVSIPCDSQARGFTSALRRTCPSASATPSSRPLRTCDPTLSPFVFQPYNLSPYVTPLHINHHAVQPPILPPPPHLERRRIPLWLPSSLSPTAILAAWVQEVGEKDPSVLPAFLKDRMQYHNNLSNDAVARIQKVKLSWANFGRVFRFSYVPIPENALLQQLTHF